MLFGGVLWLKITKACSGSLFSVCFLFVVGTSLAVVISCCRRKESLGRKDGYCGGGNTMFVMGELQGLFPSLV